MLNAMSTMNSDHVMRLIGFVTWRIVRTTHLSSFLAVRRSSKPPIIGDAGPPKDTQWILWHLGHTGSWPGSLWARWCWLTLGPDSVRRLFAPLATGDGKAGAGDGERSDSTSTEVVTDTTVGRFPLGIVGTEPGREIVGTPVSSTTFSGKRLKIMLRVSGATTSSGVSPTGAFAMFDEDSITLGRNQEETMEGKSLDALHSNCIDVSLTPRLPLVSNEKQNGSIKVSLIVVVAILQWAGLELLNQLRNYFDTIFLCETSRNSHVDLQYEVLTRGVG